MKTMTKIICMVLLLGLFTAPFASANEHTDDAYALYVAKISWLSIPDGTRILMMTLPNMGKEPIVAAAVDIVLLNDKDEVVLAHRKNAEGFGKELKLGDFLTPNKPEAPVMPGEVWEPSALVVKAYREATKARAAVSYYKRENGDEIFIPAKAMLWNSTDGTRLPVEERGKFDWGLTRQQKELADTVTLGIMALPAVMYDAVAPAYGKSEGGMWVLEVRRGTMGAKLGLKANDVLTSINGIRPADDARAILLGKLALAEGEKVEFIWLRGNKTMKKTVGK